jgi:class 3 adenylate cyclase
MGGGLFAVFDSAGAAIAAATAAFESCVLAVEDSDRPMVRIAVHAGDVLPDGEDLAGTAVAIASRLCHVAVPASVMVSEVARSMAGSVVGVGFRESQISPRSARLRASAAIRIPDVLASSVPVTVDVSAASTKSFRRSRPVSVTRPINLSPIRTGA